MMRSEIEAKLLDELRLLSSEQLADILNYTRSLKDCIQSVKPLSHEKTSSTTLNFERLALFRAKQPLALKILELVYEREMRYIWR